MGPSRPFPPLLCGCPAGTPFSPHLLGPLLDLITLRPGSTVVDVGANIGSFTIFFAAATGPQGRVYSFEPQRKMFQVGTASRLVHAADEMDRLAVPP